ncbi:MAG: AAA family ATPase, partial [Erysipelotrichaceae bacterium]|nr:AAA family ATPase [Erysipelotrichaceae bacterium]
MDIRENIKNNLEQALNILGGRSSTKPLNLDKGWNALYKKLIMLKHNLILTGAPGTGKTFIAKSVAADIVSNGTKDWDTLVKEGCCQIGFVQFHPSYDYTDFVEGLRPGENGEFRRQDGVFKEFCKQALGDEETVSEVSTNLFDKVYNELLDDIRGGVITSYERITADDRGLAVNDKNKIIFGPEATNYKTTSIRNLRLLFDYYQSKGLKDATKLTRDDLWGTISKLTEGKTKTLDYTEYRWALNQLLSRVTDAD